MHAFSEILFLRSSECKTATFQRYTGWPKKKATIKNHHYIVLKTVSEVRLFVNFERKMGTRMS